MEKKSLQKVLFNKNTLTILALIAIIGVLYIGYNWRINEKISPIKVPVAKVDIDPNTQITEEMIEEISVPGAIITDKVLLNSNDIIGRYVLPNSKIPVGSLIYASSTTSDGKPADSTWENVAKDWTIVTMAIDSELTMGNSIIPGGYIDIYYQGNDEEGKLIYTKFIENIQVLAVRDSEGNNVFDKSGELNETAYLLFAVPEYMHLLLARCSYLDGSLIPVQRSGAKGSDNAQLQVNSYIENKINLNSHLFSDDDLSGNISATTD